MRASLWGALRYVPQYFRRDQLTAQDSSDLYQGEAQ